MAHNIYILALLVVAYHLSSSSSYRLPTIITPYHYEIHLNISAVAFTATSNDFTGVAVIYFNVSNATSEIKLHSSSRFISVTAIELNNVAISSGNYSVNSTTDILTINYSSGLTVGTVYALKINYISQLSVTDMYGFYKSSYVNGEGVTTYLATTQFQPTHARRAFPCWDEPAFKATFTILITYPSQLNALSNTPGTIRTTANNLTTIQFDKTPVMSSYLVAFIVSNFTCTYGDSIDNVPYRICSRPESEALRNWSLEVGPKILGTLNEYTDFNYNVSMTKMDQVAIPDFAAGAMENWGLVTYRETGLLWDPEESSNSYKQSIAAVIAHEFVHMWFGNLVTCDWWSATFLNEGFARYYQYYTLAEVLPEWELKKQFVTLVLQVVLDTDSYLTSQALQSEASSPTQVSNKFGTITYSKGGSIFRMVENIMGSTNFRNGLRSYLKTYQYATTVPNDLWASLSPYINDSISNLPANLTTVMQNWVESSGFPLLTVSLEGRNVYITQERFLLSGNDTTSKWYVPVTFTTSADSNKFATTTPEGWLIPTADLTIPLPANATWIILNNYQTGYYRVNYDLSLWTNISAALTSSNFSDIPDVNRAQIVNDVFTLARVGKLQYSFIFEILNFLGNDTSYFPWYPAFTGFNFLLSRIGRESLLGQAISAHLSSLMVNLYQSAPLTNLNESDHIYTLKQVSAISWACSLGLEECVTSVKQVFNEYKVNGTSPNKNLKSIVYCNGLRHSEDSSDWEFLWQTYLSTELATERAVLISALGCTRNETLLFNYLAKSIDATSGIRSQDAYSVFAAVYGGNSGGVDVAFNFLIQYYEAIDNYYQSMNSLNNLMSGIVSRFTNQRQVTQLERFLATGGLSESFIAAATQSLATARSNLAWVAQYRDDLHDYYGLLIDDEDDIDEDESTLIEYRLPNTVWPSHYEVHLNTTQEAYTAGGNTFIGTVVIYFSVTRNRYTVRLHSSAQNINLQSIQLNNQDIPSANYSVNSTTDILTIAFGTRLTVDTLYALKIEYIGTFGSNNRGFYKSSYVNAQNVTRWLVTTQFEPVHARRAFPCFDEPSFKATFQVLLTYPSDLEGTANTNGSIVQVNQQTNQTTKLFNKSPIMPTYLNAFVISDFTCTVGDNVDNATYRVCSRDNEKEHREWAVEVGPKLLASLNAFTDYNYSNAIEKMDQFAIPDFASGAMENWGLVTYREPYLLWDPLESTNALKQSIATIIAHEFGHMWFGNLVTCSWWSEIFLNEGFATYFEFFTTHDVLPDWELDKQFVVRVHQRVLESDSYLTSQALQSPASTPTQISSKFGTISYSKGGSIIRMVEHIMGSDNFKAGLQSYLKTHQFNNTKPEDLWTSLNAFVNPTISRLPTDLESVMENWIKTSGYPILYVSIVRNNVVISQERFLLSGQDTSSRWYVPITYTTSVDLNKFESTAPVSWLTPSTNLRLNYPTGAQWVILNSHQTAFYRVNYANNLWDALAVALSSSNFSGIPELNRAQIADDVFEFTKVERISFTRAFRVLEFLENDVTYSTWFTVSTEFNSLIVKVGLTTPIGRAMQAHILQLIHNFYQSVPITVLDEDNQIYTLKQIIAVTLACRLGHGNCVTGLKGIFNNYTVNGVTPPKNLKSVVYCNGIKHDGTLAEWEFLWNAYLTENVASERSILVQALGCPNDEALLREYLTRAINASSGIRRADTTTAFSAVYTNSEGVDVALQFIIQNYEAIYNYFQSWVSLGSLISGVAARITTEQQLQQLQTFLTSGVLDSQLDSVANNSLNTARQNLDWIETYRSDFHEYYGLSLDNSTAAPTTAPQIPTTTPVPDSVAGISASLTLTVVLLLVNKYFY